MAKIGCIMERTEMFMTFRSIILMYINRNIYFKAFTSVGGMALLFLLLYSTFKWEEREEKKSRAIIMYQ